MVDAESEIRQKTIDEQISLIEDPKQKLTTYIHLRLQTMKMEGNYSEDIKNDLIDNLYFVNSFRNEHFEAEISIR